MARTSANSLDKNFMGGLITDYTALNFPENSCTSTMNVIYEPSGRVTRRYGFDFEDGHVFKDITRQNRMITSHLWREVNGDGNINLFVVQVGATLYFYETAASSISAGAIPTTVSLGTFATSGSDQIDQEACQFTHGKGSLFVTHPQCEPFYVTYIASTIQATAITVEIRDLAGVDDTLEIDERPVDTLGTISDEHHYNLFNQGWYFNSNASLTAWDTARSDLPSNADVWWYYKDTTDAFDAATVPNRDPGFTPAPKGHYIVEAFNIDRSAVSGIAGLPVVSTDPYRPRVVAFFAGRVWYGGVEGNQTVNKLYYSQVIEGPDQYGRCYQQNDPTSELLFDLLPTDGGSLEVSGAGTIYKLFPMGNSLLVFASNGIWAIAGSQGIGFVANDYSVVKISAVETNSSTSFVDVEGAPFWVTGDAVATIVTEDNLTFRVAKVSDNKIQRFLVSIPESCKQRTTGAFNPYDRTIQWIYRSEHTDDPAEWQVHDRILVFNLLTQAFYLFSIPNHEVAVHSVSLFKGFAGESEIEPVEVGGDNVVQDGDDVIIFDIQDNTSVPVFKYLVSYYDTALGIDRFTFAELRNPQFTDWPQLRGVSFVSEFTTGYKIHTDGQRFFQPNYVFVFLEELVQPSSCFVQGVFDYAESGSTGKWSSKQQVYNSSLLSRGVNFRRLKMRGKGRALQLKFTSEAQQPFTIIGWSIWETANNEL